MPTCRELLPHNVACDGGRFYCDRCGVDLSDNEAARILRGPAEKYEAAKQIQLTLFPKGQW